LDTNMDALEVSFATKIVHCAQFLWHWKIVSIIHSE
jgi:hypothetical protein